MYPSPEEFEKKREGDLLNEDYEIVSESFAEKDRTYRDSKGWCKRFREDPSGNAATANERRE